MKVLHKYVDETFGQTWIVETPSIDEDETEIEIEGKTRKVYANPNICMTFSELRESYPYMVVYEDEDEVDTFVASIVEPPVSEEDLEELLDSAGDDVFTIKLGDGRIAVAVWYD